MSKIKLWLCLGVSLAGVWSATAAAEDVSGDPLQAVCAAALQQNWDEVLNVAEKHPAVLKDALGRAVVAHACLAKNQNNRSYALFASLESAADLERYAAGTGKLVADGATTRDNPVAQYLRGDALARQGHWPQAATHFAAATDRDSKFALAWNALGVAHAYQDHFKDAKDCFKRATKEDEKLADAYANFGTLLLIIEAGPGAAENYRRAQEQARDFALAANGGACAALGQNRDQANLVAAVKQLSEVAKCPSVKALALANLESLGVGEKHSGEKKGQAKSGMSLSAREMLHVDSGIAADRYSRMSSGDLLQQFNQNNHYATHSERWGGIWSSINLDILGSGTDQTRWAENSFNDAAGYRGKNALIYNELTSRGIDPLAGGADTGAVALGNSTGDVGDWPAKEMRFGLIPLVGLPNVTKPAN